jgi:hypothetical protein
MAITINSAALSTGQPSAPVRHAKINVSLDASYPTGGYDITSQLGGGTVVSSPTVPHYDGAALRWFKVTSAGKVISYVNTSGAPGAETGAATNLSGHTNLIIEGIVLQ